MEKDNKKDSHKSEKLSIPDWSKFTSSVYSVKVDERIPDRIRIPGFPRKFKDMDPFERLSVIEREKESIDSIEGLSDSIKSGMKIEAIRRLYESVYHEENPNYDYLVFDTETTGLPVSMSAPITNSSLWPHIVQISWITVSNKEIKKKEDHIIKPEGFRIPYESARIHGISDVYATTHGEPLKDVLSAFCSDVLASNMIIGHNLEFDRKVVLAELFRVHIDDPFVDKTSVCTMKKSTVYCAFPGKGWLGYRYPRLEELYKKLFGKRLKGAHNALHDVEATYECYKELVRLGVIR